MTFPITEYVVFTYHPEINRSHHAHFPTMEDAEDFANDLRALSTFTVSEPIAVIATESKKVTYKDNVLSLKRE